MPTLSEQTQQTLNDFITGLPEDQQQTVSAAFRDLLSSSITANAKKAGDTAAAFELDNVRGGKLSLSDALTDGPVVLSFYRGSWCPFCNLELNAVQQRLADIEACGARLIAVSPELPDSSLSHAQKLGLGFDVLSDPGNLIAERYGLVMTVHETLRPLYQQWGLDLPAANGDDSWRLPVPATYVIDCSAIIRASHVEKDYTKRMEPDAIIGALKAIIQ